MKNKLYPFPLAQIIFAALLGSQTMATETPKHNGKVESDAKAQDEIKLSVPYAEVIFSGKIAKHNEKEIVDFDITVGDPNVVGFTIKGATSTLKGNVRSKVDYSFIRINKSCHDGHKLVYIPIPNYGTLSVWPNDRTATDMRLAGVPITGKFRQGAVDDGLWFNKLEVDGKKSTGCLDYWFLNGRYDAQGCTFGSCPVTPSKGYSCVLNYDDWKKQNSMSSTMQFGNLVIEGLINFIDTKEVKTAGKEAETVGTTGNVAFKIRKADGTPLRLSCEPGKETADDKALREYFAFVQLLAFDTFAE